MSIQSKTPQRTPSPVLDRATPSVDSRDLLRGGRLLDILHAGQRYTLRLTRENKLILTK